MCLLSPCSITVLQLGGILVAFLRHWCSCDETPPVHGELSARDVAACTAAEEEARSCNIVRATHATQGSCIHKVFWPLLLDHPSNDSRHEGSGAERIDSDVARAQGASQMLGQHYHSSLARAVSEDVDQGWCDSVNTGNVDDPCRIRFRCSSFQQWQSFLNSVEDSVGIQLHHLLEHLHVVLADGRLVVRATVVHENMKFAFASFEILHHVLNLQVIADIADDGMASARALFGESCRILRRVLSGGNVDLAAILHEACSNHGPDPRASTCHQGNFP
mmetsp:Transcript_11784/g.25527  ORF Transcript_11784/g.25527 Transcript_11784/m.25527 type:complete len:276 (+) Transcript_11784:465-1292(+)